jgi:hypothetical protein
MPITQDGEFILEDRNLYGGIRQDLPVSLRHYSMIKNMNLIRKGVLIKRKGTWRLNPTAIAGTPEIRAGYDMKFSDGTQKVVVAAGTDAYFYNTSTNALDAQSLSLTAGDTSIIEFADEIVLANGTNFTSYDNTNWTTVSGSPPIGTLLNVHANRGIVSGRSAAPYEFYYSGVRNINSWDVSNDKVIVGGTTGEVIKGLGTLGRWMFIGAEQNTWLYLQSQSNPGDWDFINLSESVGVTSHKSVFEVTRGPVRMCLYWSLDGPMVAYQVGNQVGLKPLWNCIWRMVNGQSVTPLDGIETTRFNQVSGGYLPELREACFGVVKAGNTENDMMLCYDLESLTAYVLGEIDQPYATVKDNGNSGVFPCDVLFNIRVDGLEPSATGKQKLFGGRQGQITRHETTNIFKDENDVNITYWARREGYNGLEEGVAGFRKVAKRATITATQGGGFASTVTVSADNDNESGSEELDLDGGIGLWGDGDNWTTDPAESVWNGSTVETARGNFGVHGRNFKITVTDYGVIENDFELQEMSLEGDVYER